MSKCKDKYNKTKIFFFKLIIVLVLFAMALPIIPIQADDSTSETSENIVTNFNYTGSYQKYVVPDDGTYKVELWGAKGGTDRQNNKLTYVGGYGAYTSGLVELKKGQVLYFYVGGAGGNGVKSGYAAGGWNGGGRGDYDHADDEASAAGGGATDVRLEAIESSPTTWNDFNSLKTRIMVAAGGGGGGGQTGGHGGTLTSATVGNSIGSTQTSGYQFGTGHAGTYKYSNKPEAGGGGGYYGGNSLSSSGNWASGGAGGSSFISGFNGADAIAEESSSISNIIHTGQSIHYSGISFYNTLMIGGNGKIEGATDLTESETVINNTVMPNPAGGNFAKGTGNNGNGYARITQIKIHNSDTYSPIYYGVGYAFNYGYTGSYQTFTAPSTGVYKLEAWGAVGGAGMRNSSLTYKGGRGAYTTGEIRLVKGQTIYIYVGQAGYNGRANCKYCGGYGGWNGGAQGGDDSNHDSSPDEGGGGGGATDFRLIPTSATNVWNEFDSLKSRIMVAAGGAGGAYGLTGYVGGLYLNNTNAYQFGIGQRGYTAATGTGGGGGGYFGGISKQCDDCQGFGGTSYVSGSADDLAISSSSTSATDLTFTSNSTHYSGITFNNISKIAGNATMPTTTGSGTMTGNNSHGYAKITILSLEESPAYLTSITTDKGTFSETFSETKYNYNVLVGSEDVKININATKKYASSEIIMGLGETTLYAGDNKRPIGVISETGEVTMYVLNINRPPSSYKYLEDIKVDGVSIPGFNPTTLSYDIPLADTVEKVNVDAILGRPSQTISGLGEVTVDFGTTSHNIDVISEDGTNVTTYTLNFKKSNTTKLKSLKAGPYSLTPTFDPETYEYEISIISADLFVEVEAIPFDKGSKVKITGNSYIKAGSEGLITITVSQPGLADSVYKIKVKREGVAVNTTFEYTCTGEYQTFTAPSSGYYQMELWGAQGGAGSRNKRYTYAGSKGSYVTGTTWLDIGDTLYVYVGCQGTRGETIRYTGGAGGWNGGGQGGNDSNHDSQPDAAGGGGGATDIRLVPTSAKTTWNEFDSLKSRILIAGGGAGGSYGNSGYAGGLYLNNINGYQLGLGQRGYNAATGSGGGGGGYFGGISKQCDGCQGFGGTSFASGDTEYGYLALAPNATSGNLLFSSDSLHESGYAFTDIQAIDGTQSMPSKTTGYVTGNSGNGYARITRLPDKSQNNYLQKITVKNGDTVKGSWDINPEDETQGYDFYLAFDVNETDVSIQARPQDSLAVIKGIGDFKVPITLPNENIYPIEVTAENGDVRVYNVHITRPASDNPYLEDIIISGLVPSLCSKGDQYCKLDPAKFDKDTHEYYLTVPSRIKQLQFDVHKAHEYQQVSGEGKISLTQLDNVITIDILSEDGQNSSRYVYYVTRDMSDDTDLSIFEIVDPEIEINYDPDILEYYISVPNNYTKLKDIVNIDSTLPIDEENKIVSVKIKTDDDQASYFIPTETDLNVGMNQVNIIVTARNGETKTYSLYVYREQSGNTYIKDLEVKNGTTSYPIVPVFNKSNVGPYNVTVPNDITTVDVLANPEKPTTTLTGTGTYNLNTGQNKVNIISTAEDGSVETYVVIITREKNSNANLDIINVTANEQIVPLNPTYDKNVLNYTATVDEGTTKVVITATPEVSTTKYKLLDNNTIRVGKNTKRVMAIAEDGTTKTYTIEITRPASDNNYLQDIQLSDGILNPAFQRTDQNYEIIVPNSVSTINITGIKENDLATVKGNGKYSLAVGSNEITLVVTSESGNSRTYLLKVIREANSDAYLKDIVTSEGVLVPTFDKEEKTYSINVENTVATIDITGLPNVSTTKVTGNGTYNLVSGNNPITLTTLAEDGVTSLTYTINVYKDKSDNDNLSYLLMEEGAITPKFDPNVIEYRATVPYEITTGTFHIELEDPKAKYEILNNNFVVGDNIVTIKVTSESGLEKEYNITVTRQEYKKTNSYLATLAVNPGTLDPTFSQSQQYYEVVVPYTTTKLTVSATTADPNATLTGTGTYNLAVGKNLSVVTVQSSEGEQRDYQIVITREKNNDATLSSVSIGNATMSPSFNKNTKSYSVTTNDYTINFTKIIPTDSNATYVVQGNNFTSVGNYTVTIHVTAADGVTTEDYVFNIEKGASNNNNLATLEVENFTITPTFNKATTLYKLAVGKEINSINIIATPEDPTSIIDGDGMQSLSVGENQFVVTVTSQSGKEKAYTILVTKEGNDNNFIKELIVNNATITPEFEKEQLTYQTTVPYEITSLDMIVKLEDENASYKILNNDLKVGENEVSIVVVAENGDVKTYKINVIRKEIVSALLKELEAKNYSLTPEFNSYVNNYQVKVDNEITSLDLKIVPLDPKATYTVSGNGPFVVGTTSTIEIVVTSSDGNTTETYTIDVERQAYSNNFLDYLYTDKGDVYQVDNPTQTFSKEVLSYFIDVPNDVTEIELIGEAIDKSTTVTGLGVKTLTTGANKFPITVTSTSGITRTYYVTVNRAKASENYLLSLKVKTGNKSINYELNPSFDKDTKEYNVTTQIGEKEIFIEATAPATAKIKGIGKKALVVGQNIFEIIVTSESGEDNIYKIIVNRPASSNNSLTNLVPSVGNLEPEFIYTKTDYVLNLDSSAGLLSFEYTTEDQFAQVSGHESQVIPDGTSTRKIVVTAEDGSTKEYTITVNKERTDNAKLASLSVTGYTITPTFADNVYDYYITVPNSKTTLLASEVIATAADKNAKITKNSNLTLSTTNGNEFKVIVTAPDGFTKQTYIIHVTREKGTNVNLDSLTVTKGFLTTSFHPGVEEYVWKIPKEIKTVTDEMVIATSADKNAIITKTQIIDMATTQEENRIFEVIITSEDGSTSKIYKLKVEYDLSSDATLGSLVIDKGYYSPEFSDKTYIYDVYEYADTNEITVTATPSSSTSTVNSGNGLVNLTSDETIHNIIVTAEDGSTETYTLNIHRTIKKETGLKDLKLNGLEGLECIKDKCVLNPSFQDNIYSYKIKVPYEYISLNIAAIPKNDQQKVVIKREGKEISAYDLPLGITNITIEVYDGLNTLTDTYNLEIERCLSNNTYLKELSIDGYTLDPEFDKKTQEYMIFVEKDVNEVSITATPEHEASIVKLNGYNYLQDGNNDATITVYAPDGSERTYIVHIIKGMDYNSYIKNITVSTGVFWDLTPKFNPTTFNYTTTIRGPYDKATIEAVPVIPSTIISGTGEIELKTGNNIVTLTAVAAEDGSVSTYKINIIKEPSINVDLESLIVEEGTLIPEFNSGTTKYEVNVSEFVNKLTIHAIPADRTSIVKITGNENLISGENYVNIIVTNKDKTASKTYQLLVRKDKSHNTNLSYIKVTDKETNTDYPLNPEFDKTTHSYIVNVPYSKEKVTISAQAESNTAHITGIGEECLDYGHNVKRIIVTSESGEIDTYEVDIYRAYDLRLINIISDTGTLNPEFNSEITEYTIDVPYETNRIVFIAQASSPKVTVEGSGTYNLNPGTNDILFTVKDPENNQKVYKVTVNRAKDNNNYIKELTVNGILSPVFEKTNTNYVVDVRKEVTSLDLHVVLESASAKYEILNNSGFSQDNNPNKVTIRVTADNGDIRDYTLDVNLRPDEFFSNRLLSLTVDQGQLTPDFNPDVNNYAVTVANSIDKITIETVKENERSTITYNGGTNNVVNLSLGRNIIEVKVTNPEGNSNIYNLIVYRDESNDASLISLNVKNYNILPIFTRNNLDYTLDVGTETTSLDIEAIPYDPKSTVVITGQNSLTTGTTDVKIHVTAPDGITTKEYVIHVTKGASRNNYIKELSVSGHTLDKIFTKENQGPYYVNVESSVNSVVINAIPEVSTTTITGDGAISLTSGRNVITVSAISESGETRPYTIIINKNKSSDSSLKDILLSDESLDPEFNSSTFEYTVHVPEELDKITITGLPNDQASTVVGNKTYDIDKDEFTVNLEVTAEDGNKSTYKVKIIRDISYSSKLSSLVVKNGELYPGFHKLITTYTILVPNEITSLDMIYTPEDPAAQVTVTGNENFRVGSNTVKINVVAQDNSENTEYIISVVRQSIASNYLSSLEVEGYILNPTFDKKTLYYEVQVPIETETIKINASTEDPTSTLSGTGYKSVKKGINRFYVTVESASGVIRSYQVVINRVESSENYLLTLESDIGTLNPVFNSNTNSYTLNVPSGTEELTLSGTASENALVVGLGKVKVETGSQTKTITVTSESGNVNTYTVEIVRPSNNNTELESLVPSVGTIDYSNDKLEYEIEVPDSQNIISFTATPKDPNAKVTGTDLTNLNYGDNEIQIVVTAEDGVTTRTIKVKVTRMKDLISIIPSETNIIISKGEEKTITYTLNPTDTSYPDVEWRETDSTVATVDQNGKITGVEFGSTTIQIVSKHDATILATINVNVINLKITSQVYDVVRFTDDEKTTNPDLVDHVIGAEPKTELSDFITNFDNDPSTLHIYDDEGNEITDLTTITATRMTIKLILDGKEYDQITIVVRGDVDSDGLITITDYIKLKNRLLKNITFDYIETKASDIDVDELTTITDYIKLKNYLLKNISTVQ